MIRDKVVIITGASSGIGEATAKLLASKGAKVVLGARREDKLKQLVDEIQNTGGQAVYQWSLLKKEPIFVRQPFTLPPLTRNC